MKKTRLTSAQKNVVDLPRPHRAQARIVPGQTGALTPTRDNELDRMLRRVHEACGAAALLLLRVPEYEAFVESFGYACGEALDTQISQRLARSLRGNDGILPCGTGRYMVVIPEPESPYELEDICERVIGATSGSYDLGDVTPRVSAAVGVAVYPMDSPRIDDVVRYANVALRRAMAQGTASARKRYCCFSEEMLARQRHRLWMEGEIRRALDERRFRLHYQPQYARDGCAIVGVEALLRMVSHEGDLVLPGEFIGVAEDCGAIIELGGWVLREACRQFAEWRRAGNDSLQRIAVNVSPRQLEDPGLAETVEEAIAAAGIAPDNLELEITESSVLELLPVSRDGLQRLRALGVRIAIDDFGAGYSTFINLTRLPLDTFKLDRSFLTNVSQDARARQVVNAMIAMARELGYEIVAEGVETEQQLSFLQASGCHLLQGFGLARPAAPDTVAALLDGSNFGSTSVAVAR